MGILLDDALNSVVNKVSRMFGKGNIGMIGVSKYGDVSAHFNTKACQDVIKIKRKSNVWYSMGISHEDSRLE